tara:strand:- start:24 stop:893 length:870 start_codon:yes stop_codon:yes gene_type:complete
MATNNYFKNFNSFPQQELLNSLTREVIQMSGIDILYLVRTSVKIDDILNEDVLAKYESAVEIEMYVNTPEGFGGAGDIATKFGLDVQDELNMIVNKERFFKETGMAAPREGDLIYFPLDRNLFEIRFVEDEKPFYPLGKNTVYELTCEKFVYSQEEFALPDDGTGTKEIFDKYERKNAITMQLKVAAGSLLYKADETIYQGASLAGATATAQVADFNDTTGVLNVFHVTGDFGVGQNVIGVKSAATRSITNIDEQTQTSSEYSDNITFETEGDGVLDFSELDPWSEGDL